MAVFKGTIGADNFTGTSGDDVFYLKNGNDIVRARGGDDEIFGAHHADRLYGEMGNDLIFGGHGQDILYGGADDDTIYGGISDDRISGGEGINVVYGGDGEDLFVFHKDDTNAQTIIKDFEYGSQTSTEDELLFVGPFLTFQSFTYNLNGDDLVIGYGNNSTVTIKDYGTIQPATILQRLNFEVSDPYM